MKKITFLAILLASSLSAQVFPEPYCEIEEFYNIEEITNVTFNSILVPIEYEEAILLDYTSNIFSVLPNEEYSISLEGNTYDDYTSEFIVFIDWNQNNVLDDEGEVYRIGTIFNSTGNDGISADGLITVPNDALLGNTRMRVMKMWIEEEFGMEAILDPCNLYYYDNEFEEMDTNYGQVVDLTINVTSLGNQKFDKNLFTIYPNPVKDVLNIESDKQIEEILVFNIQGQLVLSSKNLNQVDASNLPIGQYLVKATSDGLTHTNKFVKQ
jgi:hypothetical protein